MCVCVCQGVNRCFMTCMYKPAYPRVMSRKRHKLRGWKQTVCCALKIPLTSVDWQCISDGPKVRSDFETKKAKRVGVEGAASWNLSSLNPVFPAFGHSVAGKNMCCIFEVLYHVTKAGFVNQSTQRFQEEGKRQRERERGCTLVRRRESREKQRGRWNATGWGLLSLWDGLLTDKLDHGAAFQTPFYTDSLRHSHPTSGTFTLCSYGFLITFSLLAVFERRRRQAEDMSEHEWEVFLLSLSLLSFCVWVSVCLWDTMRGETEFLEDSFNWEQRFGEEYKEQQKESKSSSELRHDDDEYFVFVCPVYEWENSFLLQIFK